MQRSYSMYHSLAIKFFPRPVICPVVSPPGSSFGVCAEMCRSDDDCAFDEKCCSNRCGHQCVKGTPCAVSSVQEKCIPYVYIADSTTVVL